MNQATKRKRRELSHYIQHEVIPETCVQGIVVIGSVSKGTAREDSDIDAVVFLAPLDLYAVPAECKWRPQDGTFHGIFSDVTDAIQLDFHRVDLGQWSQPDFEWPESLRAELRAGWLAFDRNGEIGPLVEAGTAYGDEIRQARLDEAIVKLDWLLNEATDDRTWDTLGPKVAHHRLHAAFDDLVSGLFAYNRCWRTLPSRELADLLNLPWLPQGFEAQIFQAMNALSETHEDYRQRVDVLRDGFHGLVAHCRDDGLYGAEAVSEAFMRLYDEPGRDSNMAEWVCKHKERGVV